MKKSFWLLAITAILMVFSACKETEIPENRVFSINDLGHKKVGVQIGNTAEIYASDYGGDSAKIQVERFATLDEAVQALRQGELDAVLCDDAPATVFVSRSPSLRILDEVFMEEDYAGIVAKQNWALLDTVNMALIQMRAMGIYDSIFDYYIGGKSVYHYQPKEKAEGPALRIATNAEFPPYEFRTQDGKLEGIDVEIARYIADFMERPLEIIDMEFDDVIESVSQGKADIGLAGFSVTEEREKIISFTDHYAKSKIVVIVRSGERESAFQRIKDTLFGT